MEYSSIQEILAHENIELETRFNFAYLVQKQILEHVKPGQETLDNQDPDLLWALAKQATIGDAPYIIPDTIENPYRKYLYSVWQHLRGMDSSDAKMELIRLVRIIEYNSELGPKLHSIKFAVEDSYEFKNILQAIEDSKEHMVLQGPHM